MTALVTPGLDIIGRTRPQNALSLS